MGGGAAYFCLDSPPPEDADLRQAEAVELEGPNGLEEVLAIEAELFWPAPQYAPESSDGEEGVAKRRDPAEITGSMVYGDSWDEKLAAEIVEKNQA